MCEGCARRDVRAKTEVLNHHADAMSRERRTKGFKDEATVIICVSSYGHRHIMTQIFVISETLLWCSRTHGKRWNSRRQMDYIKQGMSTVTSA